MNASMQIRRGLVAIALVAMAGAHAMTYSGKSEDALSSSLPTISAMSITATCVANASAAQGHRACYEASVVVGQPMEPSAGSTP